jgi:hypothetical protein
MFPNRLGKPYFSPSQRRWQRHGALAALLGKGLIPSLDDPLVEGAGGRG